MSNVQELNQITQGLIKAALRSVRFYACGGTGINLLRTYMDDQPKNADLLAKELYTFVDTSFANMNGMSDRDIYKLKNVDGSGADRRKNAKAISAAAPEILLTHPAADLNVVVFSLAGGSGSVAGPILLQRLLSEGKSAIGVVIGDVSSPKWARNTIDTLAGMQIYAATSGRPVVVHYHENDPLVSLDENNSKSIMVMRAISIFASGRNGHLDSSDVGNMFDYHNVTAHKPGLALLDVALKEEELVKIAREPIAFAALLPTRESVSPQIGAPYRTVGYLPETNPSYNNGFYFVVSTEHLSDTIDKLVEKKEVLERAEAVQSKAAPLASLAGNGVEVDTETGLIL